MTHPDAKLLNDIEAAKKMMLDEQANKVQLRGIIKSMQQAFSLPQQESKICEIWAGRLCA